MRDSSSPPETDAFEKHIAKESGSKQRAAYWKIKHLTAQGLVESKGKNGGAQLWGLTPKGEQALKSGEYDFTRIDVKAAPTLRGAQPAATSTAPKAQVQSQAQEVDPDEYKGKTPETAVAKEIPAVTAKIPDPPLPGTPANPKAISVHKVEVKGANDIKVLPVVYEKGKTGRKYIANTGYEFELLDAHKDTGIPLLFEGAPGVAKTEGIRSFDAERDIPQVNVQCTEQTDKGDLIAQFVVHNGETPINLGAMAAAIIVANHNGVCNLHFDEINALTPQAQKMLLDVLDSRRQVTIAQLGMVITLNPDAKLLITATMNRGNRGTYELNKEFVNRFSVEEIPFPSEEVEMEILRTYTKISDQKRRECIQFATLTRNDGSLSYQVSPRENIMFGVNFISYQKHLKDHDKALKLALRTTYINKYDAKKDKEKVKQYVESTFHVKLD